MNNNKHKEVVYFKIDRTGTYCHIGKSTNLSAREESNNNGTMSLYGFIEGNGHNSDKTFHEYFSDLIAREIPGQETFYVKGELQEYLEWLSTRAYFGTKVEEVSSVYPYPGRFPWTARIPTEGQQMLTGFDSIIPNTRNPLTHSERVLATMRSESDDWYTPKVYVDAARHVMDRIDLDPASCSLANQTVGAKKIFTAAEDGLKHPWEGKVWLNPPYGGNAGDFTNYLITQYKAGKVTEAVACVSSNGTTAGWFQPLWEYPMCFTNHRPKFEGGPRDKGKVPTSPTNGIVFIYMGQKRERFATTFRKFGPIIECLMPATTDRYMAES